MQKRGIVSVVGKLPGYGGQIGKVVWRHIAELAVGGQKPRIHTGEKLKLDIAGAVAERAGIERAGNAFELRIMVIR